MHLRGNLSFVAFYVREHVLEFLVYTFCPFLYRDAIVHFFALILSLCLLPMPASCGLVCPHGRIYADIPMVSSILSFSLLLLEKSYICIVLFSFIRLFFICFLFLLWCFRCLHLFAFVLGIWFAYAVVYFHSFEPRWSLVWISSHVISYPYWYI